MLRSWFSRCLFLLFTLAGLITGTAANATTVDLTFSRVAAADRAGSSPTAGWQWVEVTNVGALRQLPPGWHLLADQTMFRTVRVEVQQASGTFAIERGAGELAGHTALGNYMQFRVPVAGHDVQRLRIGFLDNANLALLRSIKAASEPEFAKHQQRWAMLIAMIAGILICALAYNVFLLTWTQTPFQRTYVVWLVMALAYSLNWPNLVSWWLPFATGAIAVRSNYLLISGLVGTGAIFFTVLLEPGRLPIWLARTTRASAVAVFILGVAAAADHLFPAPLSDRLLNLSFIACTACALLGIPIAIQRRSRAVWFYLAGWTPPLIVFALRVARNFGLLGKSELVDMASFVAIAFEAIFLSLAIADRFRALHHAHNEAEAERATLGRIAATDPLTGLGNRLAFQQRLAELRDDAEAKLILVDVDYLKQANDVAGHDAGDALLVETARRLHAVVGDQGLVARIGGDEFAILLAGGARHIAPALFQTIDGSSDVPVSIGGRSLTLSLSAGAASGLSHSELHKAADLALYRAKADGRGRWRRFEPELRALQENDRQLLREARAGLLRQEFLLHFQPVVDLTSGAVTGHEALLRWQHPTRGLIAPGSFSIVLREPGLAENLHAEVIRMALDRLAAPDGASLGLLAINFAVSQLAGETAAEHFLAELACRGLSPSQIVIEVTESVVLGRGEGPVVACLQRFHAAGAMIALDDFGTGFASLIHLRTLPIDFLKIDRSFVSGLVSDEESRAIVGGMIALAHSLGKGVVAEGVETEAQLAILRLLGCNQVQGYLLGHPSPSVASETINDQLAA